MSTLEDLLPKVHFLSEAISERNRQSVDTLLTDTSTINPRTNTQIHTPTLVLE